MGRAHGIRGEVAVTLVTDRVERVAPGAALWVGERRLRVEASRPHQGRFLVCFAGMTLLYVTLWSYEIASKETTFRLRALKRKLGGDDAVARRGRSAAPNLPA